MRAKFIYEDIKNILRPKSEEEIENSLKDKKVVYYHADTDEFEYKGKRRIYTNTPNVASFLRTKDYLIYVKENKQKGIINAKTMASYIDAGYGYVCGRLDLYKSL